MVAEVAVVAVKGVGLYLKPLTLSTLATSTMRKFNCRGNERKARERMRRVCAGTK